MSDRHEKWQRVVPGTIIPAGQPRRVEYTDVGQAHEYPGHRNQKVANENAGLDYEVWFVDSSWKPPLVLPNGNWPRWAFVAFVPKHNINGKPRCIGGLWTLRDGYLISLAAPIAVSTVMAFIEATPEQVARIEAAR